MTLSHSVNVAMISERTSSRLSLSPKTASFDSRCSRSNRLSISLCFPHTSRLAMPSERLFSLSKLALTRGYVRQVIINQRCVTFTPRCLLRSEFIRPTSKRTFNEHPLCIRVQGIVRLYESGSRDSIQSSDTYTL